MTEDLYSEILPRLWIGGTDDWDVIDIPKTLPGLNDPRRFDAVATLYAHAHPMGWGVHEQRYGFPDAELDMTAVQRVNDLADWLYARWSSGETVLARCQAGLNRSGIVIALVLIRAGWAPENAVQLLRKQRSPHALSNPDFHDYLLACPASHSAA